MAYADSCPKVWYFLCITASGIAVKKSDCDLSNTRFVKKGKFSIEWSKNSLYKSSTSAPCSPAQIMLISDSEKFIFCLNNTSQNFEGFWCTRTLLELFSNSWKVLTWIDDYFSNFTITWIAFIIWAFTCHDTMICILQKFIYLSRYYDLHLAKIYLLLHPHNQIVMTDSTFWISIRSVSEFWVC